MHHSIKLCCFYVESTTMHPALIISLLGTYVPTPCGSATYFVQAKAGVLALAYVCARVRAHCYAAEVWRYLCCAEGGERIAFALTKQSTSCPLYKQTGYSDQYGYQTHPSVACVSVRASTCVCVINTCLRRKERRTGREKEGGIQRV